jgi:hypothetical protein
MTRTTKRHVGRSPRPIRDGLPRFAPGDRVRTPSYEGLGTVQRDDGEGGPCGGEIVVEWDQLQPWQRGQRRVHRMCRDELRHAGPEAGQ